MALPTLNEQLDNAERFYSDRLGIDAVLVSGCANDVGTQNLLNATATKQIDEITKVDAFISRLSAKTGLNHRL